jgi:hypothetical protein
MKEDKDLYCKTLVNFLTILLIYIDIIKINIITFKHITLSLINVHYTQATQLA